MGIYTKQSLADFTLVDTFFSYDSSLELDQPHGAASTGAGVK